MSLSAARPHDAGAASRAPAEPHPLDLVSLGNFVQIR